MDLEPERNKTRGLCVKAMPEYKPVLRSVVNIASIGITALAMLIVTLMDLNINPQTYDLTYEILQRRRGRGSLIFCGEFRCGQPHTVAPSQFVLLRAVHT